MSTKRIGILATISLASVLSTTSPAEAQWTASGGVLLKGTIVTMDDAGTVKKGSLLIKNGKIEAILAASAKAPAGCIEIDTKGFIYPGLMNLHDHIAYNFLPLYPVPKHYENRDQWPSGRLYEELVNNPKNLVTGPNFYDRQAEVLKYAEIKALVGGMTTTQGSPQDAATATTLVRNVELKNFGMDKVGQRGLPIDGMFTAELEQNRESVMKLDGWLFHLSEGIDEYCRREYNNPGYDATKRPGPKNQAGLKNIGLVTKSLIAIHATGLKEEDFKDWKQTTGEGAKLVWSPLSNLLLYGKTTDIAAARRQGATVALGTDWSPSGSKNLLWELKVADSVNKKNNIGMTDRNLVELVTRNPAKLVKWDNIVGHIAVGMTADLVVIDGSVNGDPYRALIEATETNVQMTMIGGDPLYGDEKWLAKTKIYDGVKNYEVLKESPGRPKALHLKKPGVPKGEQTLDEIKKNLLDAMKYDPKALASILNGGNPDLSATHPDKFKPRETMKKDYAARLTKAGKPVPASLSDPKAPITDAQVAEYLKMKYPNAKPLAGLDPIYQVNDPKFFDALKGNLHFQGSNAVWDPSVLNKYRPTAPSTTGGVIGSVPGG
jgi:hypothetical protein